MNALVVADRASEWRRLKALVLASVSSPIHAKVYNLGGSTNSSRGLRRSHAARPSCQLSGQGVLRRIPDGDLLKYERVYRLSRVAQAALLSNDLSIVELSYDQIADYYRGLIFHPNSESHSPSSLSTGAKSEPVPSQLSTRCRSRNRCIALVCRLRSFALLSFCALRTDGAAGRKAHAG
jgi:hypothetical protein